MSKGTRTVLAATLLLAAEAVMATEEPRYDVRASYPDFEVRDYAGYLVAETEVDADFEAAGNEGFRRLGGYIFGNNRARRKLEMTAPVTQSVKIAMTAPVVQQERNGRFVIQFVMPASESMATLPEPTDSRVTLREVPGRQVAVRRYSGGWSRALYEKQLAVLRAAIREAGLERAGEPVWARYNSPFSLSFARRNEIQIELRKSAGG